MKIILEPGNGVNLFRLGNKIDIYKSIYAYEYIPAEDDEEWDGYDFFDGGVEVNADKDTGEIVAIACRDNCYFNDVNLIGYNFQSFLKMIDQPEAELTKEEIWLTDDELQTVVEIDELEIQVWVNAEGNIAMIYVG